MFSSFVCQFIIVKWMTRLECQCQLSVCCVAVLTGKQLLETALWTPSLPPSPPTLATTLDTGQAEPEPEW